MGIFGNANGTELMFWSTALFGTTFFFLRIVMMIVGGFGSDVDTEGADLDADIGGEDASTHSTQLEESDTAFKIVSLNSITGFIMMFGWAGLSAYKQFHLNVGLSFLIAFLAGTLAMFVTALLFKAALKLNSPGYKFDIKKTVGLKGDVYLRIPAGGIGKVKITLDNVTKIVEAVSENNEEIDSFKTVEILRVVTDNKVSVKQIS